jgi:hypothetical protein
MTHLFQNFVEDKPFGIDWQQSSRRLDGRRISRDPHFYFKYVLHLICTVINMKKSWRFLHYSMQGCLLNIPCFLRSNIRYSKEVGGASMCDCHDPRAEAEHANRVSCLYER